MIARKYSAKSKGGKQGAGPCSLWGQRRVNSGERQNSTPRFVPRWQCVLWREERTFVPYQSGNTKNNLEQENICIWQASCLWEVGKEEVLSYGVVDDHIKLTQSASVLPSTTDLLYHLEPSKGTWTSLLVPGFLPLSPVSSSTVLTWQDIAGKSVLKIQCCGLEQAKTGLSP